MAIIWSWRYGSLQADEVEDERWQRSFLWMSDSDECAVDGVEVNGVFFDRDEARKDPEYRRLDDESWAAARESAARASEYCTIMVQHPSKPDHWGAVDTVKAEDVSDRVAELAKIVGAARVKIASR